MTKNATKLEYKENNSSFKFHLFFLFYFFILLEKNIEKIT